MPILRWIGVNPQASTSSNQPRPSSQPTTNPKATDDAGASSADAKRFGLENFGNTCYANSVLQALYFCEPFRELVTSAADRSTLYPSAPSLLAPPVAAQAPSSSPTTSTGKPSASKAESRPSIGAHKLSANGDARPDGTTSKQETDETKPNTSITSNANAPNSGPSISSSPPTIFSALRSLFIHISQHSHDKGTVAPQIFIAKLRKDNELFRSTMHQDAHEFLNYLLNRIVEDIEEEEQLLRKKERADGDKGPTLGLTGSTTGTVAEDLSNSITTSATSSQPPSASLSSSHQKKTFIHSLFEGTLTSETRCLTCETVSSRDEMFLDLSIDIEQNSSVTACLRQFSASEMLCQRNKFFCDACCGYQEAEKRMKIKRLPNILALHLKRFKYMEDQQKNVKLSYRVAFPFELRLFNTVDDAEDVDKLYELWAIVVHIGAGLLHGHYITIIKAQGTWYVFDDNSVDIIKESDIPKYYGDSGSGTGYVLFYRATDLNRESLGLRPLPPQSTVQYSKYNVKAEGGPPSPAVPISVEPSSPTAAVAAPVEKEETLDPSRSPSPVAKLTKLEIPQPTTSGASAPSATQPPSSSQSVTSGTLPSATQASTGGFFSSLRHSRSLKADRTSLNAASHPLPPIPTDASGEVPVANASSSNVAGPSGAKDKEEKSGSGWLSFRSKEKRRDSLGQRASQPHSQTTSSAITTAPSSPPVPPTPLLPPPSPRTIGRNLSTTGVNGNIQDVFQPLPPAIVPTSSQQQQPQRMRRTSATDPPNVDGSDSLSGSSSWTSGFIAPVDNRDLPPIPKDVPPVPQVPPSHSNGIIITGALTEEPQMLAPTSSTTALNQSPGTSTWSIPSTPAVDVQQQNGEKIPIPPTLTMSSASESTHAGVSPPSAATHSHQPHLTAAYGQSTNSVSVSASASASTSAMPPPSPQRPFRQSTKDLREALKAKKAADIVAKKAEEERKRVEKAEKEKEKAEKKRREAEKEKEGEERKLVKRASRKMSLGLGGLVHWGRDKDKDKFGVSSLPSSTRRPVSSEQPVANGPGHSMDGLSPEEKQRLRISLKPEAHFVPTINF
ncbi:hypothetical protein FRC17_010625 [Serendipita sp. 399]|nr:hypothetical protein FRC17_010625 [Serendipita sp. 399]